MKCWIFLKNNDKNIMNCNKTIKYSENFIRQIGKLHNKRNLLSVIKHYTSIFNQLNIVKLTTVDEC